MEFGLRIWPLLKIHRRLILLGCVVSTECSGFELQKWVNHYQSELNNASSFYWNIEWKSFVAVKSSISFNNMKHPSFRQKKTMGENYYNYLWTAYNWKIWRIWWKHCVTELLQEIMTNIDSDSTLLPNNMNW